MSEPIIQKMIPLIVVGLIMLFVLSTFDGRCIFKGGEPIDSYANAESCNGKKDCSQYLERVCIKEGKIIKEKRGLNLASNEGT